MKLRTNPRILGTIAHHIMLPGRSTIPELYGVRLIASESGLRVQTYNFDMFIEAECEAEVLAHGEATVPCAKFAKVMQACPSEVTVEAKETLSIRSGTYRATMAMFRQDGWGDIPSLGSGMEELGSVPSFRLEGLLALPSTLASHVTGRNNIEGVLLEVNETQIGAVGTDGKALSTSHVEGGSSGERNVFLPTDAVKKLLSILPMMGETVALCLDGAMLWVCGDGCSMALRVADNDYPNYKNILHRGETIWRGRLYAPLFQPIIRRALHASDDGMITMSIDSNIISVKSSSTTISFIEDIDIEEGDGSDTVQVNGERLLECLPGGHSEVSIHGGQMFFVYGDRQNVLVVAR